MKKASVDRYIAERLRKECEAGVDAGWPSNGSGTRRLDDIAGAVRLEAGSNMGSSTARHNNGASNREAGKS